MRYTFHPLLPREREDVHTRVRAKGRPGRIRGNCFPHSSRALSDAAEAHNATAQRPDKLYANADNGLVAKTTGERTNQTTRRLRSGIPRSSNSLKQFFFKLGLNGLLSLMDTVSLMGPFVGTSIDARDIAGCE